MKFVSWSCLPRIGLTQVGDPRGHGRECRCHCISADRVTGAAFASVSESVDEEEAKAALWVLDITEGRGDPLLLAEGGPVIKGIGLGANRFGSVGLGGESASSAEVSFEAISCGRWSSTQGCACG